MQLHHDDDLAAFRGIVIGCLLSLILWSALIASILIVAKVVR